MDIESLPYSERVRLTFYLAQAVEYWEQYADTLKTMILNHPEDAMENGPVGFGGVGSRGIMTQAVLAHMKSKLLRKWVSEMHVLEKDVREYKPNEDDTK